MTYWKITGAVILPNLGGFAGGFLSRETKTNWYKNLKLPSYNPPSWVFAPAWTALYSSMGYASYLVWRDGGGFTGAARMPLILYAANLTLNWIWAPIFFGQRSLKWGFIDLVAIGATAAACGLKFYGINKTAGYLYIPYLAWLSFAGVISYNIWKLNPEEKITEISKKDDKQM